MQDRLVVIRLSNSLCFDWSISDQKKKLLLDSAKIESELKAYFCSHVLDKWERIDFVKILIHFTRLSVKKKENCNKYGFFFFGRWDPHKAYLL